MCKYRIYDEVWDLECRLFGYGAFMNLNQGWTLADDEGSDLMIDRDIKA